MVCGVGTTKPICAIGLKCNRWCNECSKGGENHAEARWHTQSDSYDCCTTCWDVKVAAAADAAAKAFAAATEKPGEKKETDEEKEAEKEEKEKEKVPDGGDAAAKKEAPKDEASSADATATTTTTTTAATTTTKPSTAAENARAIAATRHAPQPKASLLFGQNSVVSVILDTETEGGTLSFEVDGVPLKFVLNSFRGDGDVVTSFNSLFERMEAQSLYPVLTTCPVDGFYAELEEECRKFTVSGWAREAAGVVGHDTMLRDRWASAAKVWCCWAAPSAAHAEQVAVA